MQCPCYRSSVQQSCLLSSVLCWKHGWASSDVPRQGQHGDTVYRVAGAKQEMLKCRLLQEAKTTSKPAPSLPPTLVHAGGASQSFAEDLALRSFRCHLSRTELASRVFGSTVLVCC